MGFWSELGEELLQVVYPENLYCMGCGDFLDGEERAEQWGLCGRCLRELFSEDVLKRTLQKDCEGKNYSRIAACTVYGGLSKEIIGKFKNNGQPWLGKPMGRLMAERFREECFGEERPGAGGCGRDAESAAVDLVTFVPVHRRKKRLRGYDQAQLLAEQVGRSLGVPCVSCLMRTRMTAAMKNMPEELRRQNVEGAFCCNEKAERGFHPVRDLRGKRVLLVDDVVTTGSTADACASVLHQAGAADVMLLTFAAAVQGKKN